MIDFELLESRKAELAAAFQGARPFRWMTIDGFLTDPWPQRLWSEFGEAVERSGKRGDMPKNHKHVLAKIGIARREQMNESHRQFFDAIQAPRFMSLLEEITGIRPIVADPLLAGGGLHEIHQGGYLNVHTDFNFHPESKLHRRLNLLYYLNPFWEDAWEGKLELWPEDLSGPFASIAPVINRMVVFETSEHSFHGHPKPLQVPPGVTRRSMAVYYYSTWPEGLAQRVMTHYRLVPWQVEAIGSRISVLRGQGMAEAEIVSTLSKTFELRDVKTVMAAPTT